MSPKTTRSKGGGDVTKRGAWLQREGRPGGQKRTGMALFSAESSRGWVSFKDGFWDECDVKNSDDRSLTLLLSDGSTKTFARNQVRRAPVLPLYRIVPCAVCFAYWTPVSRRALVTVLTEARGSRSGVVMWAGAILLSEPVGGGGCGRFLDAAAFGRAQHSAFTACAVQSGACLLIHWAHSHRRQPVASGTDAAWREC